MLKLTHRDYIIAMKRFFSSLFILFVTVPAWAEAPRPYEVVKQYANWVVICDIEEDMGDTTVLACGLQSNAELSIAITGLVPAEKSKVWLSRAGAKLSLSDNTILEANCPWEGWCALEYSAAALLDILKEGGRITLIHEERIYDITSEGLDNALEDAEQRIGT
ncbi:hypothetical protein [Epibacterium ulvae]|uniref:hypothetical protein n=1 Tax=Epibacterium ulvae TaxID=1156985 RepID=UPI002492E7A7|nr:hypothetical protein [Epibacterium ulvae]